MKKQTTKQMTAQERMDRALTAWLKANRAWRKAVAADVRFLDLWELEDRSRRAMDKYHAAQDAWLRSHAR
jgi:hypothetical protein